MRKIVIALSLLFGLPLAAQQSSPFHFNATASRLINCGSNAIPYAVDVNGNIGCIAPLFGSNMSGKQAVFIITNASTTQGSPNNVPAWTDFQYQMGVALGYNTYGVGFPYIIYHVVNATVSVPAYGLTCKEYTAGTTTTNAGCWELIDPAATGRTVQPTGTAVYMNLHGTNYAIQQQTDGADNFTVSKMGVLYARNKGNFGANVISPMFQGSANIGAITPGSAMGTSPTSVSVTGHNNAFVVTFTTPSTLSVNTTGTVFTVAFGGVAPSAAPFCSIDGNNGPSATSKGAGYFYADQPTQTTFTATAYGMGLAASTTYKFSVTCQQ